MGEKASKGMNRRSFLKGGLAAGGAVVVAGLAGCAPQAGPMPSTGTGSDGLPDQWDYETDVVAIGAGAAGIAAGIEARDLGLDIIVLESQGKVGGNSAICNGGMCIPGSGLQKEQGIEDSPELMAQDLISYLGVDVYEDYIRLLAEQQGLLWDWLNDLGVEFRKESLVGTTGQSVPREHHVVPGVTITNLCDAAKERGAEFMLNTTAKHFVQDPASKMVIGVQAEDKSGKAIYLKARKGVLLCSGGYARNVDMLNKWIFGEGAEAYMETCGDAIGQDGSGILMAMEIGADTRHIDYINMLTAQNPKGTLGQACSIFHVGAIMVNKEGNRFVNEAQGYINTWVEGRIVAVSRCGIRRFLMPTRTMIALIIPCKSSLIPDCFSRRTPTRTLPSRWAFPQMLSLPRWRSTTGTLPLRAWTVFSVASTLCPWWTCR